jgi:hypothetical protein
VAHSFLREGRRLVLRLFGVLGTRAIIAVCLLVAAGVTIGAWRSLWIGARGTAVEGTVVRQIESLSADFRDAAQPDHAGLTTAAAQRLFQAVVEYKVGERAYQIAAKRVAPVHLYPLGSSQVVVFFPDRPQDAYLRAELPDMWGQAILLLMGTVIAVGSMRWWWWLAQRRPHFRRRPQEAK